MKDVIIIGGGPAGVTAALRARELGATVALIERGRLGGTCTNDGCVPTRVLAKAARLMRDSQQFADYGLILCHPPVVDFAAVMRRTKAVVEEVQDKKQLVEHLQAVGVALYAQAGNAHFIDAHTMQTEHAGRIEGDRFVLCVGGRARELPFPGAHYAITSSSLWDLDHKPSSVAIIGGGATGCQLASVFADFGVAVTLLDIADRVLVTEDHDTSAAITGYFEERGIRLQLGIGGIDRIDQEGDGFRLGYHAADGTSQTIAVGRVIASVGWPGNVDPLRLDAAGVKTERSYVLVDDQLRTNVPHIYAAGDITGRSMLVQSAGYQARIAVENALLPYTQAARQQLVPHGGFTDPEYGSVGLTEAQARQRYDVVVARVPYADLDRAVIDGRLSGFCKLVVDRRQGKVLGAHVVGEHAVEIVSTVSAGMASGLSIEALADLELAYPTFVSILGLAARQIVRDRGTITVAAEWRELRHTRGAEWERTR